MSGLSEFQQRKITESRTVKQEELPTMGFIPEKDGILLFQIQVVIKNTNEKQLKLP